MFSCYCGSILLSNGEVFSCPHKDDLNHLFGQDKNRHAGIEIIDKRRTIKDRVEFKSPYQVF